MAATKHFKNTKRFHGSQVMVWGCLSYDCEVDLINVCDNVNAHRYNHYMHAIHL